MSPTVLYQRDGAPATRLATVHSVTLKISHPAVAMDLKSSQESSRTRRRNRLWDPSRVILDHKIEPEEHSMLSRELLRKVECQKNNRVYMPDPEKDTYDRRHRVTEPLDFGSRKQRAELLESLQLPALRRQSQWMLHYSQSQHSLINKLMKAHSEEPAGSPQSISVEELIKRIQKNIAYIDNIRGSIALMLGYGEEAADHFGKCVSIMKM